MLVLIMAGGGGSRLNRGEKPLLEIAGRPMISYVIDAFVAAGCEPVVVTTARTPMTRNWCRARDVTIHNARGNGYIDDMVEAVKALDEEKPLFVSVSDLPCVTPEIILSVCNFYDISRKDACSTWVPASSLPCRDYSMPYREQVNGIEAFPAGLNILCGDRISEEQDEAKLLLHDAGLAINVNTPEDIARAEEYFRSICRE